MRAFCVVILLVAAVLSIGCPKARERVAEKAAERVTEGAIEQRTGQKAAVDIDRSGQTVTVTGEEGKHQGVTGPGATLPADWPADLPSYPSSQIMHSATNKIDGKLELTVVLKTKDSAAQVLAYYAEQTKAAGYVSAVKMDTKEGGLATYETAAKRLAITVAKGQIPTDTMISLVLMDRQ